MHDPDPPFRPVRRREGYLPLENLGLIGDGATAALVGLDGSISWMCLPRFDAEPLFCGLLDQARGGHFTLAPEDLVEARQRYEPDTGVLTTELRTPTGLVRVTDALALRSGADLTDDAPADRAELVRSAVVLAGNVRLRVDLEPAAVGRRGRCSAGWKCDRPGDRTCDSTCGPAVPWTACTAHMTCSKVIASISCCPGAASIATTGSTPTRCCRRPPTHGAAG